MGAAAQAWGDGKGRRHARSLLWPRGHVRPWVDGWVDAGIAWGELASPQYSRNRADEVGAGDKDAKRPRLSLPALPTPGFTAEIRVSNGSSVGCWLGQAGSWGRRWDLQPPPRGSLGRREAAQRRWQGEREAIAIAEDTVPVSVGPLRHRPPPRPPGTRPLGPSSSQEAGPGKGQAGRDAGA